MTNQKNSHAPCLLALEGAGHAVGVGVMFMVGLWTQFQSVPDAVMVSAIRHEFDLVANNQPQLLFHLTMSALVWTLIVFAYKLTTRQRGARVVRAARARRGSVMVETLIAVPVFLTLLFGLVQMTLNNTAAIMTSLAAFEAGRSAAIWQAEAAAPSSRIKGAGKTSSDDVTERARMAASTVLASVASASFSDGCSTSSAFSSKMTGMTSASNLAGIAVPTGGLMGSLGTVRALSSEKTLATAFDDNRFEFRGALKMITAYCNTTATVTNEGPRVRTVVEYDHKLTVPMMGRVFMSKMKTLQYYSTIRRTFVTAAVMPPNPAPPQSLLSLIHTNPFDGW